MKQSSHINQYDTAEQAKQDITEVYKTVVLNKEKGFYFLCVFSKEFARKWVYNNLFYEVQ